MTKGITLLILCQLVYVTLTYSNDPISVHVEVPLPDQADMTSTSISLEVEIQNDLGSSLKLINSYIKSGGMQNSFYRLGPKEKASFIATKKGKGKGSFTDLYPEEEQNTTSGIVTLQIGGKTAAFLTLFWEVSSNLDIPNTIGYYWGNQTSNANMYELILNEQLSNSFVKKSYETWIEVDLDWDIKMAFFISDQKEAKAKVILWPERSYLVEGIYTITWDAGLGKELCLEPINRVTSVAWGYCVPNDANQQWVIYRNTTDWYSLRSNNRRELVLRFSSDTVTLQEYHETASPPDVFKFNFVKEDGRWRASSLAKPGYLWTGDFSLNVKNGYAPYNGMPYSYPLLFKQKSDSYSNQLFTLNLVKFTGN